MKTIRISHPHSFTRGDLPETVMALGYFDGVHLGHQKVIQTAKDIAELEKRKTAVMTFYPHPTSVLKKESEPKDVITPIREKERLIESLGVDILYIVEFTPIFASLTPQEFVDNYIINLNVKHITAGFDFSFGHMGKGNMENFPSFSRDAVKSTTVKRLSRDDSKISSTLIRQALKSGDVQLAAELLGRPHYVKGTVIHGDKRGRTIGFPTANTELSDPYIVPPTGVYSVIAELEGKAIKGVCNIGYKPTFKKERASLPSIEVHLFNFDEMIYGKELTINWMKRIRSEQKFNGINELIEQISKDKEQAYEDLKRFDEKLPMCKSSERTT
ncbi:bifunctional riboflavin kinase/FAD synthetase [Bacillus gobiensis]|uniref:bifunctional riboflavin kinase/FAD synthetase n=1 Tax=Bacillus gobiensis TaxID=1441095 RepID=UPI003D1ABDC7